jgi:hypothetical protein
VSRLTIGDVTRLDPLSGVLWRLACREGVSDPTLAGG